MTPVFQVTKLGYGKGDLPTSFKSRARRSAGTRTAVFLAFKTTETNR